MTVDCELTLQQMITRFAIARVLTFEVRDRARIAPPSPLGLQGYYPRQPRRGASTLSVRPVLMRPRSAALDP